MNARIRVEPPDGEPFERDLETPEVIIGRSATSGLVVMDSSVSRQHARLFQRDGRWHAEDLGAMHVTVLNDAPLAAPTALKPGDRIKVGGTVIVFGSGPTSIPTESLDQPAARLRTLNEVHRALSTAMSLSGLLELILERCFEVLRPEEGVILLRDNAGQFTPAVTRQRAGPGGEVFVSRSIVDEVAGRGTPMLVFDAAVDERFSPSHSIVVSGIRSVLAVPLSDAEGSIGMIALSSRASVRQFSQQDLDMLASLASAAVLRVRNIALAEEAAARRVLEREMALAHDMQMSMLPRHMPDLAEIDLAGRLTPAQSVGGDLYDFVLDGDRLWFIVADVSGKGVAAALYMAVAKTLFRATVQGSTGLVEVLTRMNRELCRDNDQMIFITALVGHLSLVTGVVTVGDAGHNPAFAVDPTGGLIKLEIPKCIAFGVVPDAEYTTGSTTLRAGDTLVLYTDGLPEARNSSGEIFGDDRLERVIRRSVSGSAAETAQRINDSLDAFAAGAPPQDDLTLLVLRYRGNS